MRKSVDGMMSHLSRGDVSELFQIETRCLGLLLDFEPYPSAHSTPDTTQHDAHKHDNANANEARSKHVDATA